MEQFENPSYRLENGRIIYTYDPFEDNQANLRALIRFLIEELGISLEEVQLMLRRDLGFRAEKASEEVNAVVSTLRHEMDEDPTLMP